ncbi:uncharacterized protein CDV56_103083 [Aspergillus thermomutatus]|uniref:DUF7702 domain-containing protein n=1 Tax=Aspergillus thermomutatus TaxID=41047 RepID=A0A397H9W1_ASPTH|nr:uncharacterized protein CDV56_103083 [Aspergillus thermomutatus]RHZ59787.1 hypothetical protein CDV56_103083 [Aspergillus thermomutatus]
MSTNTNRVVSIVELAVYIPALIPAVIACKRHEFGRSSGWHFTLTLCLVRIAGSTCQLILYSNNSVGLLKATLILEYIGLAPLLLATLGMLSRFVVWVNTSSAAPKISIRYFRLVQLAVVIGAVLGIIGAGKTQAQTNSPSIWSEVAVIFYVAAGAALVLIFLLTIPYFASVPESERPLAPAIGVALPLDLVRLTYQVLVVFVHRGPFSRTAPSVGVRVGMALVEEFVVVAIFLLLGFRLDRLDKGQQGPILSRLWKDPPGDRSRSNRKQCRRRHGGGVQYEPAFDLEDAHTLQDAGLRS